MSTGALLLPPGYMPLDDNGDPVPSGKIYFYRTGTTTAQDTYSDSTLDTANTNPVVLNSSGRLTTLVYGDSASGFDYRIKLTTSADVQIFQLDDLVVDGADTATITTGSFTATLTGMDASTTGTIDYVVVANSAGTGKLCILRAAAAITGTSNTTAFTMTGLPAACQPAQDVWVPCEAKDNNAFVASMAFIDNAAPSVIEFYTDAPPSATGWTNSSTKGIDNGWSIAYLL